MTEQDFYKDYPSLNERIPRCSVSHSYDGKEHRWIDIQYIQEHCLDKQKIKEAFEHILNMMNDEKWSEHADTERDYFKFLVERQKKVLGL